MRRASAATRSCALTFGGLDPGGGAGVIADLRAFQAAGAWGAAIATTLTVQSTAGLVAAHPVETAIVLSQARELFAHQRVRAAKTGALGSIENARAVLRLATRRRDLPFVVDPVMLATRGRRGARLLDTEAIGVMRALASRAALVTPNAGEASVLLGTRVENHHDQREAARQLVANGARAALVKGGHLRGDLAIDILATSRGVLALRASRIEGRETHGGGCTLSALIAGKLATSSGNLDDAIVSAVRWAKRRVTSAIRRAQDVGDGLLVLEP